MVCPCRAVQLMDWSNATRGSILVCRLAATAHPTILLAYASVTNATYANEPDASRDDGDVGHVQASRSLRGEPAFHQVRPAARASGGARGDRVPSPTHPLDPEGAHDVQHLVTPDPTPSPADQPTMDFPIPVHRHEPVRVCVCSIGSEPVEHLELVHVSGWFWSVPSLPVG